MIQQENMYEICIIFPVENDTKNIFFTTKQQQESLAISLQVMHQVPFLFPATSPALQVCGNLVKPLLKITAWVHKYTSLLNCQGKKSHGLSRADRSRFLGVHSCILQQVCGSVVSSTTPCHHCVSLLILKRILVMLTELWGWSAPSQDESQCAAYQRSQNNVGCAHPKHHNTPSVSPSCRFPKLSRTPKVCSSGWMLLSQTQSRKARSQRPHGNYFILHQMQSRPFRLLLPWWESSSETSLTKCCSPNTSLETEHLEPQPC